MSVKVNLLPREVEARVRERRIALGAASGLLAFVLLLALFYVQQYAAASHAGNVRDDEQAELVRLERRADELAPYRELARRFDAGNTVLAGTMAMQISFSRVLNDLALVFPANSSMLTFDVTTPAAGQAAGATAEVATVGSLQFTGYSVERYAPGVESVLLGMGDSRLFQSLYLSTATRTERGQTLVTSFTGSGQLTTEVYSGRFLTGLPEELR